MLTYRCEDCGGIVEGASKLPRHPGFVRSVEENNLLEEAEVVLEESWYRMILLNKCFLPRRYCTSEVSDLPLLKY